MNEQDRIDGARPPEGGETLSTADLAGRDTQTIDRTSDDASAVERQPLVENAEPLFPGTMPTTFAVAGIQSRLGSSTSRARRCKMRTVS